MQVFSAVVGSPPYQKSFRESSGRQSGALYHLFFDHVKTYADNVSMIYPIRWTLGGQGEGIDNFREQELNSKQYKNFFVNETSELILDGIEAKDGLCYFLWSYASIFYGIDGVCNLLQGKGK